MKAINSHWKTNLAIGFIAILVPFAVIAHGPQPGHTPNACMDAAPPQGGPMLPPPGMVPPMPPPGLMPPLPYLRGLELTEAQQDKVFELMLSQAPIERTNAKAASKAMDALRQLAASGRFDNEKARVLAETHAQALTRLVLMHAELEAKVRAMLTPEQRKQIENNFLNIESRSAGENGP